MARESGDKKSGMTVQEAGRKGGETTAERHGPEFYSEIGRKGGEAVSQDREHMSEIGRKGGEARGEQRGGDNNSRGGGSRGGSR